jgi:GR25 family glycosyltransferase involved in LPS biosynthesis
MDNPFDKISKIYCINLRDRPDRWAESLIEFNKFNISFERFEGIKPQSQGSKLENGRLGCISSFCEVAKRSLESKFNTTLILEDDFEFLFPKEELFFKLNESINDLPENWDCLYLGANVMSEYTNFPVSNFSDKLLRLNSAFSTHAMLFSNEGLTKFVQEFQSYENMHLELYEKYKALDIFFASSFLPKSLSFIPKEILCSQRASFSSIEMRFCDYKKSLIERLSFFQTLEQK